MLESLGAHVVMVRKAAELDSVDALVIPGGESTVIDKLMRAFHLRDPLLTRLNAGMPVLGTCAGMILLARDLIGAAPDQQTLGTIPMTVRRNAFGRQIDSAEVNLVWGPDGATMSATFIRAPWVHSFDPGVEVLATANGPDGQAHPVAVQYGHALATAFHPEITADARVHTYWLSHLT